MSLYLFLSKLYTFLYTPLTLTQVCIYFLQTKLFPAIHLFWKAKQKGMMNHLRAQDDVVVSGDGRHDSMGHSAKYCAYTIFSCTKTTSIIHFNVVQVINITQLLHIVGWCLWHQD